MFSKNETPSVIAIAMPPPSKMEAFLNQDLREGSLREGAGTAKL